MVDWHVPAQYPGQVERMVIGQLEAVPLVEVIFDDEIDAFDPPMVNYVFGHGAKRRLPLRIEGGVGVLGQPSVVSHCLTLEHLMPFRIVGDSITTKPPSVAPVSFGGLRDDIEHRERIQVILHPDVDLEVVGTREPVHISGTPRNIIVSEATSLSMNVTPNVRFSLDVKDVNVVNALIEGDVSAVFENVVEADVAIDRGTAEGFVRFTNCDFVTSYVEGTRLSVTDSQYLSSVSNGESEITVENIKMLRSVGRSTDRIKVYGETELLLSEGREQLHLSAHFDRAIISASQRIDAFGARFRNLLAVAGMGVSGEATNFFAERAVLSCNEDFALKHSFSGGWRHHMSTDERAAAYTVFERRSADRVFGETLAKAPSMNCGPLASQSIGLE